MSDETLKRRNIHPAKSIGCCLPGYKLTFTYRGYVGVEPVFADITVLKEGELNDSTVLVVEGVVHCITKEEMALLDGYGFGGIPAPRHNQAITWHNGVLAGGAVQDAGQDYQGQERGIWERQYVHIFREYIPLRYMYVRAVSFRSVICAQPGAQ